MVSLPVWTKNARLAEGASAKETRHHENWSLVHLSLMNIGSKCDVENEANKRIFFIYNSLLNNRIELQVKKERAVQLFGRNSIRFIYVTPSYVSRIIFSELYSKMNVLNSVTR